jgi:excisionase family DNA binding protein
VQKLADLTRFTPDALAMQEPTLYSIQEARRLLGGISRNTIYQLLRTGQLASVVIGCRRFISRAAIDELIAKATTTVSPSRASTRSRVRGQTVSPLASAFLSSRPSSEGSELTLCVAVSSSLGVRRWLA